MSRRIASMTVNLGPNDPVDGFALTDSYQFIPLGRHADEPNSSDMHNRAWLKTLTVALDTLAGLSNNPEFIFFLVSSNSVDAKVTLPVDVDIELDGTVGTVSYDFEDMLVIDKSIKRGKIIGMFAKLDQGTGQAYSYLEYEA